MNDPAVIEYIATRCSALYLVWVSMLSDDTAPERQKLKDQFSQTSMAFQKVALAARMTGSKTQLEAAAQAVGKSLTAISMIYGQRISDIKTLNNDMFSDPLIKGDYAACKAISDKLVGR